MKKLVLVGFFCLIGAWASAQEFLQVTAVESIIPGGLGRSRLITIGADGKMEEVKLENFFSMVGINFGNIRSNDQMICQKITELAKQGWTLIFVTTGVESDAGKDDGNGIYITRYMFKK
ncbi:MAG: hypothetical protein KKA07_17310 [Bacteroidetes bacterium]|nr:hypothetical protein [Bacteroidota bacterium]MBU1720828.1 hypothetical protein [Bacteroidota bacterium]